MSSTVMVTGANRGLGLEFARQYAADGWRVLATYRNPAVAGELLELAEQDNVQAFTLDVSDFDAIAALAEELQDETIDVFLSNAGLFGPKPGAESDLRQSFGHIDYGIVRKVLTVNSLAPLKCAESFVEHIARSEQRKFVALSSIEGSISRAQRDLYAYRTSKAALNMVTRLLSGDLADRGITVVSICPGWVKTRMGGEFAKLELTPAIRDFRGLVARLTLEESGRFIESPGNPLAY
ncbi:MAG: SDR family oxidoreductase [Gammaproteobacteria bacterium]|nr:SDR family oxidoreductase [Gammaproteobacteria bacterium]MDE0454727.1 SDR family oxidoreductase [Gammaproteobacteria bacterium]